MLKKVILWGVVAVIALAVIGSLNGGGGTGSSRDNGDTANVADEPERETVTVSGTGIMKSEPFTLEGNYKVEWSAEADNSVGCYHGANLSPVDEDTIMFEMLVNEMVETTASGTTRLYNIDKGEYYVDASSGCDFTFKFIPTS